MRTLWIAGLGAVLISGGVAAQGMSTPGSTNDRQMGGIPTTNQAPLRQQQPDSPDQIRRAQDPRLSQDRMQTQQNMSQPAPLPPALQGSTAQQSPANIRETQDPRLQQQRLPARQNVQSGTSGDRKVGDARRERATDTGAMGRTNAPRNPADRAYMGGGMILENGRPVPLPGDPPGMGSDFQGARVGQSGGDPGAQTNVGQTGTRDQGMVGTSQGAFPANPPTPGGRVPTGN
jgi:hypothetical protein